VRKSLERRVKGVGGGGEKKKVSEGSSTFVREAIYTLDLILSLGVYGPREEDARCGHTYVASPLSGAFKGECPATGELRGESRTKTPPG